MNGMHNILEISSVFTSFLSVCLLACSIARATAASPQLAIFFRSVHRLCRSPTLYRSHNSEEEFQSMNQYGLTRNMFQLIQDRTGQDRLFYATN